MNYDLANLVSPVQALPPAVYKLSIKGAAVDMLGFHQAMLVFSAGACTDGSFLPVIEESSDAVTWFQVDWSDVTGPNVDASVSPANSFVSVSVLSGGNAVQKVSYIGNKRYIRIGLNVLGSPATGMLASAEALLGMPTYSAPAVAPFYGQTD